MFTVEEKQAYSEGLSLVALVNYLKQSHIYSEWRRAGTEVTYFSALRDTSFSLSEREARAANADIARLRAIHFGATGSHWRTGDTYAGFAQAVADDT